MLEGFKKEIKKDYFEEPKRVFFKFCLINDLTLPKKDENKSYTRYTSTTKVELSTVTVEFFFTFKIFEEKSSGFFKTEPYLTALITDKEDTTKVELFSNLPPYSETYEERETCYLTELNSHFDKLDKKIVQAIGFLNLQ